MKFHHIGYVVKDLNSAIEEWSKFGFSLASKTYVIAEQKVKVCFLQNYGDSHIELVQPDGENTALTRYLKGKVKYYHLAYISSEYSGKCNEFIENGAHLLSEFSSEAFAGKRCSFFLMPDSNLIEIIL